MVEPTKFFFNTETAADNEFMHEAKEGADLVGKKAIEEHNDLRKKIQDAGIEVVRHYQQSDDLPDSLFPNNWISTHRYPGIIDERLVGVYPMKCLTRQSEINQKIINDLIGDDGRLIDLSHLNENRQVLEGTGVLIFDAPNQKIYAGLSQRCEKEILEQFLERFNAMSKIPFKLVTFTSKTHSDTPIYHTNVMFSLLSDHAVIGLESLHDEDERDNIVEELTSSELNKYPRTIIDISLEEVSKMGGNILCVLNRYEDPCVIMPSSAYYGFTSENRDAIETNYKIIHSDVRTIEDIGGGSARGMVAEIF